MRRIFLMIVMVIIFCNACGIYDESELNVNIESGSEKAAETKNDSKHSNKEKGEGIYVKSLDDAVNILEPMISEKDYEKLSEFAEMNLEELDGKEYLDALEEIDRIINKFGLKAEEIIAQNDGQDLQIALYNVRNYELSRENMDTQIDTEYNTEVDDKHSMVWKKIKKITPRKYLAMINRFEISTDGKDGSTAFVHSDDNMNWSMSVDIEDILDENYNFTKDGIRTLIHEISHIISLNSEQMGDYNENTLTIKEGSLKQNSYLNLFYYEFWKDEYGDALKFSSDEEFNEFWEENKNNFVSEYASNNPVEDFAESFAEFVLNERKDTKTISNQKINFFYEFPELTDIRNSIRKNITNFLE